MQNHLMKLLFGSSALLLAAACDNTKTASVDETVVEAFAVDYEAVANEAVNDPDRWPNDAANDERRKPDETLAFMKSRPACPSSKLRLAADISQNYFRTQLARRDQS